jgi:hypothetical protein
MTYCAIDNAQLSGGKMSLLEDHALYMTDLPDNLERGLIVYQNSSGRNLAAAKITAFQAKSQEHLHNRHEDHEHVH